MASDAPEGGGSNAALLDVEIGWPFNFHLRVNDPPTARSLSPTVANALGFGLGAAGIGVAVAGIGIGFLCYKHPEFVMRIVENAFTATGLEVGSVTPGSILVELHCYTEESFRSFMEDFEARKVQERLNKEFENSGYIGEELEVTITNYKEADKFLEQISRQPESSKRDIRKREVSDDRDPTVPGKKVTVERYFSETISFSTAAKRKRELLSPGSGFESFGGSYGATMGAPRELERPVPKRGKSSASSEAGQSVATTSRTADDSMATSSSTAAKRKGKPLLTGGSAPKRSKSVPRTKARDAKQSKATPSTSTNDSLVTSSSTAEKRKGDSLSTEEPVPKRGKSSASSEVGQSVTTTPRTADDSIKDGVPDEDVLEELSVKLGNSWERVARRLKFEDEEVTVFHKENEEYAKKALKMLFRWKRRDGSEATYRVLHAALSHKLVGRKDLAETFCCNRV